jgi:hypothetical protein
MAEAIVPTHELGLIVGSGEVDVFSLFCRRPRVEGKRSASNGLRGWLFSGRSR